jgi:methionyl-tRNA formyltransferase
VRGLSIGADEDAGSLTERLSHLAAEAVADALKQIANGTIQWTEQDHSLATEAPKLERADAQLDWREASDRIACRIRAMAPKPGAVTSLEREPLRILAAESLPASVEPQSLPPGTVLRGEGPHVRVATGDGWLIPLCVQRAGGKPLAIDAFLRGRDLPTGLRLGEDPQEPG